MKGEELRMSADTMERVAVVELTRDEAMALLSLCAISIKSIDEQTRAALDKLAAYCKSLVSPEAQA